ncbi:MAG: hypothetical protein MJZ66_01860 [Bacteroidales bacterium]|nr:hypothetical protein [Bacteroidales bacterium]
MRRLFFVGCAALALTFASCSSNKNAEQAKDAANQATEQAVEAAAPAAAEVKEVVNEALVALQNKLADFKAKVEKSTKADAAALMTEAKSVKDEIDAATLSDSEKAGLIETFNAIIELCKNLK